MKIVRNETARDLLTVSGVTLTVYFEPLARASQFWRERGRTHSQAFRFTHDGREYWGETVRTFDRAAPSGERVRVDVELRTLAGRYGRALPENQRQTWRAAIKRQFARDLAAFVEADGSPETVEARARGMKPEPVPAGPEAAATVSIETNWAAAAGIIAVALENGTGEGRQMAREELQRMAALADERNALARAKAEAEPAQNDMREALLSLAMVANETAHCVGEPGEIARDEMDSAIAAAFAALGTVGAGPSPAQRIAEAARIAREARGGFGPDENGRALLDSILAALEPPARPVERVTVADAEADGSPCYRVAAEAADGSPVELIQYAPGYPEAESLARTMAARFRVDIYDSTAEGRAALARS
jgi:hypothetical protein